MKALFTRFVLLGVLLLSTLTASAYDAYIDGICYNFNKSSKTASVTSGSSTYSGDVVIPTSVVYDEETYSVTSIEDNAFRGCSSLTSVTIPNSVTSIGYDAFYGCSSLPVIDGCRYADTYLVEKIDKNVTSVNIKDGTRFIGNGAFYNSSLTSVTIPNSVTSIGDRAFYNCRILTSVTIPNSVTSIGSEAFYGCSSLTSVTIPNSVTWIGSYAFYGCSSLTSVTMGNSVTSIEDNAFEYCSSLTSIIIPNSVTSIGYGAFFGCRSLTSITIPNSVTSIGDYAFSSCSSLASITIPNSVTSIEDGVFEGCSSLTSITIPNSVTSIGYDAFDGCSSLPVIDGCRYADTYLVEMIDKSVTSVNIKDGTRFIGNSAFYTCRLTSVTIPNSVTSIGYWAFSYCGNLSSVTIGNSVTRIESSAFKYCSNIASVTISCKDMNDFASYVSRNDINDIFHTDNLNGKKHIISINGVEQKDITIPNSVTSIGDYAFRSCIYLTSVNIPNSVRNIGDQAFSGCPIENLTINAEAFCSSDYFGDKIKKLVIGDDISTIQASAFYGCTSLNEVVLGKGVREIGSNAFTSSYRIEKIYSLNPIPPTCANESVFHEYAYKSAVVYVPTERQALERYKSDAVWSKFYEICEMDMSEFDAKEYAISTSETGYATFYSSESAYTLPNGLSAQVVTDCKNNKLTYKTLTDGIIPKGTAVMLVNSNKTAETFTLVPSNSTSTYTGTNYLHGSDEATTTSASGDNYFYKLTYGEGAMSDVFGWYWGANNGAAFQIAGHKAWLALPKSSVTRSAFFDLDDDETAIEEVNDADESANTVFDLQGRRINMPSRTGIYIVNGKKVVIKK